MHPHSEHPQHQDKPAEAPVRQPQQNLAVPIAIVAAGILIAGAIILTNKEKSPSVDVGTVKAVSGGTLADIAKASGVDKNKFIACYSASRHNDRVTRDLQEGIAVGVQGTPASFIVHKNGRIEMIGGAIPFDQIKPIIDSMQNDNTAKKGQPTSTELTTIKADDHILGNPDAPIKIVEYSDFQCPFCKRFDPTMKQIMETYGKTGQVAWVYRHFPLEQIHPQARPLANASECVTELGGNEAFWRFVDKVMSTQSEFDLSTK